MLTSRVLSVAAATAALALLTGSMPATAATWADDTGDTPIQDADISSYELTNSVKGIEYSVNLVADSYAAKRQSFLQTEIDLGGDGSVDLIVYAQSPYRNATVENPSGKELCQASAAYVSKTDETASISVQIPGSCVRYAVRVSAQHRFLVSTSEEDGLDLAGSLDDVVTRKILKTKASSQRKARSLTVDVVADPLNSGRTLALQVKSGRSWKTLAKDKVSRAGKAQFSLQPKRVKKGASARVIWGRTVMVTFRVK